MALLGRQENPNADRLAALAALQRDIDRALLPAPKQWLLKRIVVLFSHFFAPNFQQEVAEGIAEDWAVELGSYPAWAVQNACRWWISADNPSCTNRPVPGQIAARAKAELEMLRFGPKAVRQSARYDGYIAKSEAATIPTDRAKIPADTVERRRAFANELLRGFDRDHSPEGANKPKPESASEADPE